MSHYHLDKLLAPRSIALVGASPRHASVGRAILRNLREAGFEGKIHLVNPRYGEIDGVVAVPRIQDLPEAPDLAVLAVPPHSVPDMVAALGARGCASVVVITSGLGHADGSLAAAALRNARTFGMRLVGPNCLGVLAPRVGLNASFTARMPQAGDLALISQSGAIVAGLVEWAARRRVGFSGIVSLGDQVDVDFADCLDFFAEDQHTRAILLYVESISNARKFMSAARAAARIKPVVVVKTGRNVQGAKAASTHTGALVGSDEVYDAAFRRAGLLRVTDLDELFAAAETLGRLRPFLGKRLAVLTNGGGMGVLAVDRLVDLGGTLAGISTETMRRLDLELPATWSKANPVDIGGDSGAARYEVALEALLADTENDAILVMNVPTALASALDAATAVAGVAQRNATLVPSQSPKPVFAVWVGDDPAASESFDAAGIPHFSTESEAVGGFMHLVRYREVQEALMETPPSIPEGFVPDLAAARRTLCSALAEGRRWLDPVEVGQLLSAYGIPTAPVFLARNPEEAVIAARPLIAQGLTIVVKIMSADIVHKSEVGGVRLNLTSEQAVREAASQMLARAGAAYPEARIASVTVHPMILRPKARELIAGIADDPTFGPIVAFGHGGTAVEVINDKSLALPPIDIKQARDLIGRTRVSLLLKAYRNVPAVDEDAIALALVKLAQMAADLSEIREVDLNPILADENGLIVVDARVAIAPIEPVRRGRGHPRFAIRPYPKEFEKTIFMKTGERVLLRPIRPEDEQLYHAFFPLVTAEDLRMRFFGFQKDFSHGFIARLTQLDYARAIAFVAIQEATGIMLGVVRLHASADYDRGEFAVLVRSDLKGRGLGWMLMQHMIDYARAEGIGTVEGQVLFGNTVMLAMCKQLGFTVASDRSDPQVALVTLRVPTEAPVVGLV